MKSKGRAAFRLVAAASLAAVVVLGASCATPLWDRGEYRFVDLGMPNVVVLGEVRATFESPHRNPPHRTQVNRDAYAALLAVARSEHGEDVDVFNIAWMLTQRGQAAARFTGGRHDDQFSAYGVIVRIYADGIEAALSRAIESVAASLPVGARIAVAAMVEHNGATRTDRLRFGEGRYGFGPIALVREDFLVNELEHILVDRGFVMVTSALSETHVAERRYWGFAEDAGAAAGIGRFAGAGVVVIVGVDGYGGFRRLRLRAVNTATERVIATASERF